MSLKAKLEAVIYASEEPVTLAQLAGLFADEALEWKAEQAAAAQAEAEEPAADENENSPLVQDTLPDLTVAPDAAEEADASEKFAESAGEDAGATVGQEADATNSETVPKQRAKMPVRRTPTRPRQRQSARLSCATAKPAASSGNCSTS